MSGENVAFVLALAGPLLRRLSLRPRFAATVGVIAFFALVTRFEPSVLRASMMAALAVTATTLGRDASRLRLLALAVAVLLVLDPFLVRAVGFQLSVAASAGIVLLSPPIARAVPGPRSIVDALAVTIGAQAGVAPILVAVFGGVPLATVPANLLAAPAAALVMVWGVGAGLVAGVFGGRVAAVLHWPTSLLVGWIAAVAHWGASLPLGEIRGPHLGVLVVGAVAVVVASRGRPGSARRQAGVLAGAALMIVALLSPLVAMRVEPENAVTLDTGARLWRAGGGSVLELDGRAHIATVLDGLRQAGARRLDVVIVRTATASAPATIDTLRRWGEVDRVLTPGDLAIPGAEAVTGTLGFSVDSLDVIVTTDDSRLVVDIGRGPPV